MMLLSTKRIQRVVTTVLSRRCYSNSRVAIGAPERIHSRYSRGDAYKGGKVLSNYLGVKPEDHEYVRLRLSKLPTSTTVEVLMDILKPYIKIFDLVAASYTPDTFLPTGEWLVRGLTKCYPRIQSVLCRSSLHVRGCSIKPEVLRAHQMMRIMHNRREYHPMGNENYFGRMVRVHGFEPNGVTVDTIRDWFKDEGINLYELFNDEGPDNEFYSPICLDSSRSNDSDAITFSSLGTAARVITATPGDAAMAVRKLHGVYRGIAGSSIKPSRLLVYPVEMFWRIYSSRTPYNSHGVSRRYDSNEVRQTTSEDEFFNCDW